LLGGCQIRAVAFLDALLQFGIQVSRILFLGAFPFFRDIGVISSIGGRAGPGSSVCSTQLTETTMRWDHLCEVAQPRLTHGLLENQL